jgi:hypothetical protein
MPLLVSHFYFTNSFLTIRVQCVGVDWVIFCEKGTSELLKNHVQMGSRKNLASFLYLYLRGWECPASVAYPRNVISISGVNNPVVWKEERGIARVIKMMNMRTGTGTWKCFLTPILFLYLSRDLSGLREDANLKLTPSKWCSEIFLILTFEFCPFCIVSHRVRDRHNRAD